MTANGVMRFLTVAVVGSLYLVLFWMNQSQVYLLQVILGLT